jgi:hypothetical protein
MPTIWMNPRVLISFTDDRIKTGGAGGRDEKMSDLFLLPADFGRSRLFSDRERNTRVLHCAEFLDQEMHRR